MHQNVTELFHQYRFALRDLWNRSIWADEELRNWNSVDHWNQVKPLLFRAIVLEKLDLVADTCLPASLPAGLGIYVVPGSVGNATRRASIRLNPLDKAGRKTNLWNHPIDSVTAHDTRLRFVDFFDFSSLDYLDIRYFLVNIEWSRDHKDIEGLDGLVDV